MSIRQTIAVLVLAIAATTAWGQMTVTQSSAAPTANVVISATYTGTPNDIPFYNINNDRRDVGQSFPAGGGFALDKITVQIHTLEGNQYDGNNVRVDIFTMDDANDYTPNTPVVASASFSFPSNMFAAYGSGNEYLTFDIPDQTLTAGQQYGFLFTHQASVAANKLVLMGRWDAAAYAEGRLIYWRPNDYQNYSADLTFWLQAGSDTPQGTLFIFK